MDDAGGRFYNPGRGSHCDSDYPIQQKPRPDTVQDSIILRAIERNDICASLSCDGRVWLWAISSLQFHSPRGPSIGYVHGTVYLLHRYSQCGERLRAHHPWVPGRQVWPFQHDDGLHNYVGHPDPGRVAPRKIQRGITVFLGILRIFLWMLHLIDASPGCRSVAAI